jgi:predicted nucleic acid-binding Zn ribbon protein
MARRSSVREPGDGSSSSRSAAAARGSISRRQGAVNVLAPAQAPPLEQVATCLDRLRREWRRNGNLAALWQAWPKLAGPQLAPHCRPLRLQSGCLVVGAAPGPWLQALQYTRPQLLGALRAAGFAVREVRVEQHHAGPLPPPGSSELEDSWRHHPSRVDRHGTGRCPRCGCPAPAGEIQRWGHCGFCRCVELASPPAQPSGAAQ